MARPIWISPSADTLRPSSRRVTVSTDDRGQLRLLSQIADAGADPMSVDELAEALRILRLHVLAYDTLDVDAKA